MDGTRIVVDIGDRQSREYVVDVLRSSMRTATVAVADQIEHPRPFIVLDLKGMNPNPNLLALLREHGYMWIADQIEDQAKRTRIQEPGLWGVVEASSKVFPDERRRYVRMKKTGGLGEGNWSCATSNTVWDNLLDPVLIREGMEEL